MQVCAQVCAHPSLPFPFFSPPQASDAFDIHQTEVEQSIRGLMLDQMGAPFIYSLSCVEMEDLYIEFMYRELQGDALKDHISWRDVPELRCEAGGHPCWCSREAWA